MIIIEDIVNDIRFASELHAEMMSFGPFIPIRLRHCIMCPQLMRTHAHDDESIQAQIEDTIKLLMELGRAPTDLSVI